MLFLTQSIVTEFWSPPVNPSAMRKERKSASEGIETRAKVGVEDYSTNRTCRQRFQSK